MSLCDFQYKGFRQLAATGQLGFGFGFIEFKRLPFSAENWLKYVHGTKKSDFKLCLVEKLSGWLLWHPITTSWKNCSCYYIVIL